MTCYDNLSERESRRTSAARRGADGVSLGRAAGHHETRRFATTVPLTRPSRRSGVLLGRALVGRDKLSRCYRSLWLSVRRMATFRASSTRGRGRRSSRTYQRLLGTYLPLRFENPNE